MDRDVKSFNVRLRTIRIRELIIGMIIAVILANIISVVFPPVYYDDNLFFIVLMSIGMILFAIALYGTAGIRDDFRGLLKPEIGKELSYVLVLNVFFSLLLPCILSNIDFIISVTDPNWISLWTIDETAPVEILIFDVLATIIFAPITEELIFRGVLFNRLKIRTGIVPAILVSSLLFGLGHEFGGIISAFLFGICMCILYIKTDNILITIAAHFLNNMLFVLLEVFNITFYLQMPFLPVTTVLAAISAILLLLYIVKEVIAVKNEY